MSTLLRGTIHFPPGTPAFSNATITFNLEAVGMMDAPAQIVAQQVRNNISYEGKPLPFTFDVTPPDPPGRFNLRVHVSLDASEGITPGDYVTKQAYRVLHPEQPDTLRIDVEEV